MTGRVFLGDTIFDTRHEPKGRRTIVDPFDPTRCKEFESQATYEDLLFPVVKNLKVIAGRSDPEEIPVRRQQDLLALQATTLHFVNPHAHLNAGAFRDFAVIKREKKKA